MKHCKECCFNMCYGRFDKIFYDCVIKTYVLSHFEYKNDVTIIVKLLYAAHECSKNGAVCRNTSKVVKLKIYLLQHLRVFPL